MKTHLGGISMKLSNLEHCENTKTHRFLPLIELPDIDGASSIRTLEQPQRNDALSYVRLSVPGAAKVCIPPITSECASVSFTCIVSVASGSKIPR
jgi:hypothetical protein